MSEKKPVRISVGFSDKQSENYNSTAYSVNLEMDVQVNVSSQEVEDASEKLFRLCRKIVENQKSQNHSDSSEPPISQQPPQPKPTNIAVELCSPAQIKCIFGVAKSKGLQNGAITALANRFNKPRLEDLTKQEASQLIKELKS